MKISRYLSVALVGVMLTGCSNVQTEYEKQKIVIKQQKKVIGELTDTNTFLKTQNVKLNNNLENSKLSSLHNTKVDSLNSIYEQKLGQMIDHLSSLNTSLPNEKIIPYSVDGGVAIRLPNTILFKAGSSSLSSRGRSVMKQISVILKKYEGRNIRIDGHTDSDKIKKSKYSSNWALGAARAVSIVEEITRSKSVDASKFSIASYSKYQPIDSSRKSVNRRVEIVILDK